MVFVCRLCSVSHTESKHPINFIFSWIFRREEEKGRRREEESGRGGERERERRQRRETGRQRRKKITLLNGTGPYIQKSTGRTHFQIPYKQNCTVEAGTSISGGEFVLQ